MLSLVLLTILWHFSVHDNDDSKEGDKNDSDVNDIDGW